MNSNSCHLEALKSEPNRRFFGLVILKIDGWHQKTTWHLRYATSSFKLFVAIYEFKLELQSRYAQFESESSIFGQCDLRKLSIWVKIVGFSVRVTLKFDGWSRKTIRHPFCATASFLHHFVPICEFKLQLQSGNAQIGSKFYLTFVTLTSDLWP